MRMQAVADEINESIKDVLTLRANHRFAPPHGLDRGLGHVILASLDQLLRIRYARIDENLGETLAPGFVSPLVKLPLLTILQAEADPGLKCCKVRVLEEQVFELRMCTRWSHNLNDGGLLDHAIRKKTINFFLPRRIAIDPTWLT